MFLLVCWFDAGKEDIKILEMVGAVCGWCVGRDG